MDEKINKDDKENDNSLNPFEFLADIVFSHNPDDIPIDLPIDGDTDGGIIDSIVGAVTDLLE